jgi:hypothetical protein
VALLEKRRYLNNRSGDFPQVILIVPSHVPNTKDVYCTSDFTDYANCDIARTQCNFIETQGNFIETSLHLSLR